MIKICSAAIVGALLASSVSIPAYAQHAQPGHGAGPRPNHPGARVPPRKIVYRDVTISRGHKFRKGQRLAANQRRYVVNDWNNRGLRQPPRGYQWVREDNNTGDYLLVAATTGIIASILAQ